MMAYSVVVLHQEPIPSHNMGVEGVSDGLINGHGNGATHLAQPCLVYRLFIDIISADSS